jgi:2-alkyl-3-oxoalkanoate reductase
MDLAGDTILVTGATGSLGGALAPWLAGQGARVRALVRAPEKAGLLRGVEGLEIVPGNLQDAASLRAATQGCRYVMHCAAALAGDMRLQRATNVEGTRHLAQAAAQARVERMVHVSTLGVYGQRVGHFREELPLTPDRTVYSQTKAEGEEVLRAVARETGLRYAIVRPGAIYGPRGHWTRTIMSLVRRQRAWFIGPGTGALPLIYMDDLLQQLRLCAVHPVAEGEAFNAAYAPHPSMRQILLAFAALRGDPRYVGVPIVPLRGLARGVAFLAPADSALKDMPMLLETLVTPVTYSMDKAQRLLDWQPRVGLAEGAQRCVPWMRQAGLL